MKIQVCNAQTMFDFFKNGSSSQVDRADAWKGEGEEGGIAIREYRSDPIELPSPFSHAIMNFRRVGKFYEFSMGFINREAKLFVDSSPKLIEDFRATGHWFLSTTMHGTGYVLDARGIPLIGIRALGEQQQIRELSLGSNGSYKRVLGEYEDFAIDMGLIQSASNVYLESILRNSKEVPNREAFSKLQVYVNI